MRAGGLLVIVLALAGCSSSPPGEAEAPDDPVPPSLVVDLTTQDCTNAVLVRLVPFDSTDRWLPPGFHPRDAQHFVGAPAATNLGAAVLAATKCGTSSTGGLFEVAFAGIFVEAVEVPGVDRVDLEFYEVERLGPRDNISEALSAWGWPVVEAAIAVTSPDPLGAPGETTAGSVSASVVDAVGPLYSFEGVVAAPFPQASQGIRLWNAGPQGIAYVQYDMPIAPAFGPARCTMREGSLFADLGGTEDCLRESAQVATYPGLSFDFHVRTFPGVVL